jgi:copper chaperone CopZ
MNLETIPTELTYVVLGMSCSHCKAAITDEVTRVAGVSAVDVDLETKRVTVRGDSLDETSVRGAIAEAGYDAEP